MVFGLLATEIPADRRSATLNLVYLPLYAAGIVGPALGAGVTSLGAVGPAIGIGLAPLGGVANPFVVGGVIFLLGALVLALRRPGTRPADTLA